MNIRACSAIVACFATIVVGSTAAAQDTTRTRDSMQMMQRQNTTMTAQVRDSLISRLLDSASRVQDTVVAQRLRDSVTTLRAMMTTDASMQNNMTTQQRQEEQRQQAMQRQQATQRQQSDSTMQRQSTSVTSDQRVRIQKDGRPTSGTNSPAAYPPVPGR